MSENNYDREFDNTILVAKTKDDSEGERPFNAGVIDSDEWERMLKEFENQSVKPAEEGESAAKTETTVTGTRASRNAAKKAAKKAEAFSGVKSLFQKNSKNEKADTQKPETENKKTEKKETSQKPENKQIEENQEITLNAAELKPEQTDKAAVKKKKKKKASVKKHKVLKIVLLSLLAFCVVCAVALGIVVYKIIDETPEINPNNIYSMLSQSSVIYDINGNIIDNIYAGDALRTNVEFDEIPTQLVDAFVSIEDKTFWDHHGFNFIRIAGAVWQRITGQSSRIGGTSTITQQLARNIYLEETKSDRGLDGIIRKIREAYYTIIIEKTLSKEQICEAYLNTVYLGFNSNGVYAAAKAYFNKDLQDLTLIECAQLAALPQSPNNYAPLKRKTVSSVTDMDALDIVAIDDTYVTYYNDAGESRVKLVLYYMHDQGKISDEDYETAKADSVRNYLNPGINIGNSANDSSYFSDYITSVVMKDLQNKLGYTYQEAYDLLYKGGLIVHSTMDMSVQNILEEVYSDLSVFPKISLKKLMTDKQKNIIRYTDDEKRETKVTLYAYSNMINEEGQFVLTNGEFKVNSDGSVIVYKGGRLNFYNTKSNGETDVRVDIKDMYEYDEDILYSRSSNLLNIPSKYKSRDSEGNLVIAAEYFELDDPSAFIGEGTITFDSSVINLGSKIVQPQSAMVIIDNATGQIRAMMGGRGIKGKLLYNRATNPRQTGSSIKPLSVYSTALQYGYDNMKARDAGEEEYGTIFTAATVIDNIPSTYRNELWPNNVDGTFKGRTYLRYAVQQSLNTCSVSLFNQLPVQNCINNLLNYGISSLVLTGEDTDENAAALALGGFIKGVSPLEMCSAYTTFVNNGVHYDETCYTTVTNRKGEVILTAEPAHVQVLDEPVASLMLNILESVVTEGSAGSAKLKSQPSAGKTGTTSDHYDVWFCGLTPKYSASTWLGCDTNIDLGSGSSNAVKVWKTVMEKVGALDEKGEFTYSDQLVSVTIDSKTGMLPSESEYAEIPEEDLRTEWFIKGTEPTEADDEARGYVTVCADTGYLATPYCQHTAVKYFVQRPSGHSWEYILSNYVLLEDDPQSSNPDVLIEKDKTGYLNIIDDSGLDYPDYYCPVHNNYIEEASEEGTDTVLVPEYPISPIAREEYDTENLVGVDGHYETDSETGEKIWIDDTPVSEETGETEDSGETEDPFSNNPENTDPFAVTDVSDPVQNPESVAPFGF